METIHFLYPDENGCIYCKRINGLIKILPMKTPCLTCGKLAGTIQGAGCECVWNDFDFENGGTVAVFDPREKRRERLMGEVRTLRESLKEYGVEPPVGFPYVSEKDMEDWLALWQRFKVK